MSGIEMSEADQLLVALAGGRDSEALERAATLPAGCWAQALNGLTVHGLAPLLSHLVGSSDIELPDGVRERLRGSEYAAVAWTAAQEADLAALCDALDEAGIPCLLFKGAAVARTVYPRPHLRTMSDSDILVPEDQIEPAYQVALSLGYAPVEHPQDFIHPPELSNSRGAILELQPHSLYMPLPDPDHRPLPVPFADLLEAAVPVSVRGRAALACSPTDSFIQLTCNFFSRMEEMAARPVRWVRDYAQLLSTGPGTVSWRSVLDRCHSIAPELVGWLKLTLGVLEPFLGHLYGDDIRSSLEELPRGHRRFAESLGPERLLHGWHLGPLRILGLLRHLIGFRRTVALTMRRTFVPRAHIVRQTGIEPDGLAGRFYPVAFLLHLRYHLVSGQARRAG